MVMLRNDKSSGSDGVGGKGDRDIVTVMKLLMIIVVIAGALSTVDSEKMMTWVMLVDINDCRRSGN